MKQVYLGKHNYICAYEKMYVPAPFQPFLRFTAPSPFRPPSIPVQFLRLGLVKFSRSPHRPSPTGISENQSLS